MSAVAVLIQRVLYRTFGSLATKMCAYKWCIDSGIQKLEPVRITSKWFTFINGSECVKESCFAIDNPTSKHGASPGPDVTAIARKSFILFRLLQLMCEWSDATNTAIWTSVRPPPGSHEVNLSHELWPPALAPLLKIVYVWIFYWNDPEEHLSIWFVVPIVKKRYHCICHHAHLESRLQCHHSFLHVDTW